MFQAYTMCFGGNALKPQVVVEEEKYLEDVVQAI